MVSLTVISPGMEIHKTGCSDIQKSLRRRRTSHGEQADNATDYEGTDFAAAVLEMDTDLASWFGEEPYQEDSTSWSWANCHIAPCAKAMVPKGWKHHYELLGSDSTVDDWMATPEQLAEAQVERAQTNGCQCGCGGQPKGKKSRFLPGHDMRVKR